MILLNKTYCDNFEMIKYTRATTRKSIYSTSCIGNRVHDYPGVGTDT